VLPDVASLPGAAPQADDQDSWSWLITFSDLVLQLFGFSIVALAIGASQVATHGAAAAKDVVIEESSAAAPVELAASEIEVEIASRETPTLREAEVVDDRDRMPIPRPEPEPATEIAFAAAPPKPAEVPPPDVAPQSARLTALVRYLEKLLPSQGDALVATVERTDGAVVVAVADGFASGSATPSPAMRPLLAEIGALAGASPDVTIEIAGHTDDRPIHTTAYASNLELSLARASRIARDLVAVEPGLAERVFASGYGEQRPVAANDEARGRARNRRIEIRLSPVS
jgi:chemotaxis protein MotB